MKVPCGNAVGWAASVVIMICLLFGSARSQSESYRQKEVEEIVISFEVRRLVKQDIFVQYDGETIYLPIVELFNLLDINITADLEMKRFHGFFISKDKEYDLDFDKFKIKALGKEFPYLASEYYLGVSDLFIRIDLFKRLFGLDMEFDFSSLNVRLKLDEDFPAYRKLQRQLARKKLKKEEIQLKDIVRLPRQKPYLGGAAADWMISSNPVGGRSQHYYYLNTGGMLLGGDLNVATGGSSSEPFDRDQFNFKWHYYFEGNRYIQQAEVGQVQIGGSFGRQLDGAHVTNRPQERRRYFQTVNIMDFVGEGWEVELYVDNKLVDYTVTDQTGIYSFVIDVFYGTSTFQVKMYGPNGEIRNEEKVFRVPYNLIPRGQFEYAIAGGTAPVLGLDRRYLQANAYYGALDNLSVGLNLDLPLETKEDEKRLAAIDGTYKVLSNLVFNGSLAPGYAYKAGLNFSRPDLVNLNTGFTKYFENRFRNPLGRLYNIVFSLSSPMKLGSKYLGLRYYVHIDKYPTLTSINMNYGFSLSFHPAHLTYIGKYRRSEFQDRTTAGVESQILLSTQLTRFIRPQFRVDYDHTQSELIKYGVYIAKRIFRTGQLTLSYERNFITKSDQVIVSLNLMSSFANFTSRLLRSGGQLSVNQLQRGSVRYDWSDNSVRFDRLNSVGYGSAVIRSFHDANYNGIMDESEEYIPGLRARMDGGRQRVEQKDQTYYYDGLRPYDRSTVQIDAYSLDNPLLRPASENYEVIINPNVVTAIKVPIVTASDITGHVARQVLQGQTGIGGIKVVLVNVSRETLIELTTFNNGDYYYLGLLPGSYRAYIDPVQLSKYGYLSQPEQITFEVEPTEGGTTIEDINFLLVPKN